MLNCVVLFAGDIFICSICTEQIYSCFDFCVSNAEELFFIFGFLISLRGPKITGVRGGAGERIHLASERKRERVNCSARFTVVLFLNDAHSFGREHL